MLNLFSARIDGRRVVIVRLAIGTVCVFRSLEEWRVMSQVFRPEVARFPVFEWLPVLTRHQALILVAIWFVAAVAFTVGWWVRPAGLILAAVMGATLLIDQQLYFSHLYLLTLEVLLLAIANPTNRVESVAYWPILLLKIQLSIVYLFAALSKLNPIYLSGYMIGSNLRLQLPGGTKTLVVLAVASIIIEVFLAFALWSKRLRKSALLVGVLFHAVMVFSLDPAVAAQLALFAVACLAIYPLFFVPKVFSFCSRGATCL